MTEILPPESTTITVTEQVGGKVSVTATVPKDGEVPTEGRLLGPEETYSDGVMVKPKPGKSAGERRWSRGGRMWFRMAGVAVVMAVL